jgi:hypothetical protein
VHRHTKTNSHPPCRALAVLRPCRFARVVWRPRHGQGTVCVNEHRPSKRPAQVWFFPTTKRTFTNGSPNLSGYKRTFTKHTALSEDGRGMVRARHGVCDKSPVSYLALFSLLAAFWTPLLTQSHCTAFKYFMIANNNFERTGKESWLLLSYYSSIGLSKKKSQPRLCSDWLQKISWREARGVTPRANVHHTFQLDSGKFIFTQSKLQ